MLATSRWRAAAQTLRDLVCPPVCLHCGGLCEGSPLRFVCARCEPLIVRVTAPHCTTCGHPFFGVVEGERMCPHCVELHPAYREARTLVLLKGPARDLVLALKYHHSLHVLEDVHTLARQTAGLSNYLRGAVLVPVPLHPRKQRERGYNQSRLLAEVLAQVGHESGGGTRVADLLVRVEDTVTQTAFDRAARRERMKNAFSPAPGAAINPELRYLLVDDVFTTGSTLNACARTLRRAGCLNLDVLTFGHG